MKYLAAAILILLAGALLYLADHRDQKANQQLEQCHQVGNVLKDGECVPPSYHKGDDVNKGA